MAKPRHKINALVSVIRTDHGWHDGGLNARVLSEIKVHGHWEYIVEDTNGIKHEVRHQRDMITIKE